MTKQTNLFIFFLSYLFICTSFCLSAQSVAIHFDIRADTIKTPAYKFTNIGENQTFVSMAYGHYNLHTIAMQRFLENKTIQKIELLYTDFPKGSDFELLNKRRLAALYILAPHVFGDARIEWTLVVQTSAHNQDQASKLPHGFVITYRSEASKSSTAAESKSIKEIALGKAAFEDSTVYKAMKRNKWKKTLVVADLTGSMSPYTGQLLLWYKQNTEKENPVKEFVFFNDGDNKPQSEKELGKAGGIYLSPAIDMLKILDLAILTMSKGHGGDSPENNIEALMTGIAKCPDCENIVLIADNWADVRDIALLSQIRKPVKIIVCGAKNGGINSEYLQIARATKGSIHTIDKDIYDLNKLTEGQSVKIGKHIFKIQNGVFVQIK
jgi:hypothetical protein